MATREASAASNDRDAAWGRRLALGAVAVAGSAAYAASFRLAPEGERLAPLAGPIAVSAGLSWLALGAALLAATRARPSVLAWADACLAAMAVGIAALLASVLLNLLGRGSTALHLAVLVASNASMAVVFVLRARALGLPPAKALALWLLALDGAFLLLLKVTA